MGPPPAGPIFLKNLKILGRGAQNFQQKILTKIKKIKIKLIKIYYKIFVKFMLLYKANDKKIIKIPILSIYKQRQTNKIKSQYYITYIKDS